jgi:nitrogen regulatory protein P-II 1
MKKVEAIIAPHMLDPVRDSLVARGVQGLTVTEVRASGDAPPSRRCYRGAAYELELSPKLKLEIVAADEDAMAIALTIVDVVRTDHVPDGSVTIGPVENAVRIRTGEHGPAAIYRRFDPSIQSRSIHRAYAS